jgi:DNA-binding PadR family transcriptional regulator
MRPENLLGLLYEHRDEGEFTGLSLCRLTGKGSGAVYPALARLEDRGHVSARWQDVQTEWTAYLERGPDGHPRRRYYALTEAGEAAALAERNRHEQLLASDGQPQTWRELWHWTRADRGRTIRAAILLVVVALEIALGTGACIWLTHLVEL